MKFGNIHYITTPYNETKFQLLLENHLKNKRKGEPFSDEFIEEAIAAFLEFKDSSTLTEFSKIKELWNNIDIQYLDCRSYTQGSKAVEGGNPLEAIEAFIKLNNDF